MKVAVPATAAKATTTNFATPKFFIRL